MLVCRAEDTLEIMQRAQTVSAYCEQGKVVAPTMTVAVFY